MHLIEHAMHTNWPNFQKSHVLLHNSIVRSTSHTHHLPYILFHLMSISQIPRGISIISFIVNNLKPHNAFFVSTSRLLEMELSNEV